MVQRKIISDQDVFDQALLLLREVLERDEKRHLPDRHISMEEHEEAADFLYNIQKIKDYDPTPQYGEGEPAYSLAEMHSVAHINKQIAKGRVSPFLYRVK